MFSDMIRESKSFMHVMEVYDNYKKIGIDYRPITEGEENEMVRGFIEYRKESFAKRKTDNGMMIFTETKINQSYPDIIFIEYIHQKYDNWCEKRNMLVKDDYKVLHFIYQRNSVTSQQIIKGLNISYQKLLLSIESLIDAKLVDRLDGEWAILNKKDMFGVKKIETVEAKISNWNKVIQQALINKSFASESFVLSKRKRFPKQRDVEMANSFGIGIYLFDSNKYSQISKAKYSKFPLNYNSIYLNECIGRIINS